MNRRIQYINLLGVLLLALLCGYQWKANWQLQTESIISAKDRFELAENLANAEKAAKGRAADLEQFREQLSRTILTRQEAEEKRREAQHKLDQLSDEIGQVKANHTTWTTAVALRDEQLNLAADQIKKLAVERNDSTEKFNDIVQKYNAMIHNFEARTKLFNELAEKYNALVKSQNEPKK